MEISYLGIQEMNGVFEVIKKHFARHEQVPNYSAEKNGLAKMQGVLKMVRSDMYYPTVEDKATYLIIQINKGHFFSNGNKRVALTTMLYFILLNSYEIREISKFDYRDELTKLFPLCTNYTDFKDFLPEEFGYYNLSIIIADHEKYLSSFDELKNKVKAFLQFSIMEVEPSMSG